MNTSRLKTVRDRLLELEPAPATGQANYPSYIDMDILTSEIDKLPPVDTLDMSTYHAAGAGCRTLGCIAGLAITLYPREAALFAAEWVDENGSWPDPLTAARAILGLTGQESWRLFLGRSGMTDEDLHAITPEQAAAAVGNLLAGKDPDSLWDHVPRR